MTNGNEPAYPCEYDAIVERRDGDGKYAGWKDVKVRKSTGGLTKREEFAKAMMVGLLSNPEFVGMDGGYEEYAKQAKMAADALLAELAKETGDE